MYIFGEVWCEYCICMLDDNYIEVVNINFINFILIKDVFWIYIILIIYKIFD